MNGSVNDLNPLSQLHVHIQPMQLQCTYIGFVGRNIFHDSEHSKPLDSVFLTPVWDCESCVARSDTGTRMGL